MKIEIISEPDNEKKQLFIDNVCVSGPHRQDEDCYKEFISEIVKQKGMLEFNRELPF